MRLYPYSEMQSDIAAFITQVNSMSFLFADFFGILRDTGLRFTECSRVDLWNIDDPDMYYTMALKGGNKHFFKSDLVPKWLLLDIQQQKFTFKRVNIYTCANWMHRFYPAGYIYHETKSLTCHFFRHYYIKKLNDDGWSSTEIADYIGEKKKENVDIYIYSDLYCTK